MFSNPEEDLVAWHHEKWLRPLQASLSLGYGWCHIHFHSINNLERQS